ncbi:MAG TPA: molybdenum ABC transporter ATP-binding protein, partial [Pseudoalteromonas sp.]|nr:molybdenum ABC transporter ATP-binding protein [Pseudoalteromonas sp.]
MRSILLKQFNGYLSTGGNNRYYIKDLTWQVKQGEHWVLLGGNGAGKSALGATLIGEAKQQSGQRHSTFNNPQLVSSDLQKQLLSANRKSDKPQKVTDILFSEPEINSDLCQQLITALNFDALLNHNFTDLSTGETRKLLLIKALSANSDLVV